MFTASISSAYSSGMSMEVETVVCGDDAEVRGRRVEAARGEGRKPEMRGTKTEVEPLEMGAAAATQKSEQAGGGAIAMAASLWLRSWPACLGFLCVVGFTGEEGGPVFWIREAEVRFLGCAGYGYPAVPKAYRGLLSAQFVNPR
jgi:hypothetical protein